MPLPKERQQPSTQEYEKTTMKERVRVRVPASTSNCGSGFDCLGLALNLYGQLGLEARSGSNIRYVGEGSFGEGGLKLVNMAAKAFFAYSDIPMERGLGSSGVLVAGILGALNAIFDQPLSSDALVEQGTLIEGHPDNVAAGIMGGFTVARFCPERKRYMGTQRIEVDENLHFLVLSPESCMKTESSRAVLPRELAFRKVVSSLNSLSYLIAAFATRNYDALSACDVEHLHEPYRLPQVTGAVECLDAGKRAGALCGWLSGSGSSLLCVAHAKDAAAVLAAMESSYRRRRLSCQCFDLQADNHGLKVF